MKDVRFIIYVDKEVAEKVKKQAEEATLTPETWIAWLVRDYAPPHEVSDDE